MKELVCKIQPFDLMQTIFLMEDGKQKQAFKVETTNFVNECFSLWSSLNADRINLKSHKKFSIGLKKKLEKTAKAAYSGNKIEIILTR